jgi:hypothetical protein
LRCLDRPRELNGEGADGTDRGDDDRYSSCDHSAAA